MIRTIEQLREEASRIEEATRQGENTQIRVGGLFQDIIDFIGQIPITQTILGPLLTALNNSQLIDPSDGQTLTFSIMDEGWTFSDALTQLQLRTGQISSTVTSNYEAFLQYKDLFQQEIDATDQRVRSYKTDYDNSQIEYATWKSQTDTSIAQFAAAFTVDGRLVSMSEMVQTAYDITSSVTNNKNAADTAFEKVFNVLGLTYSNPSQSWQASWVFQKKDGIYGAAATFDNDGNILSSSVLGVTVAGIESRVGTVEGNYSAIVQTYNSINATVSAMGDTVASLELSVVKQVNGYISNARLKADKIDFVFSTTTSFIAGTTPVMTLDASGNLLISGTFSGTITNGRVSNDLWIGDPTNGIGLNANGPSMVGYSNSVQIWSLGFGGTVPSLMFEDSSYGSVLNAYSLRIHSLNSWVEIDGSSSSPSITFKEGSILTQIKLLNGKLIIQGDFPTSSTSSAVWVDSQGYLRA